MTTFGLTVTFLTKKENVYGGSGAVGQWDWKGPGNSWESLSDSKVFPGPGATVVAGAVVGTLVGLGLLAGSVLLYHHRVKALEEPANDIK